MPRISFRFDNAESIRCKESGEHAGAVFFREGGAAPGPDRFRVFLPGRAALLEVALDDPPGHLQPEARDRRPVRQREDVGRFERLVVAVDERLRDLGPGEQAVDAGLHVQGPQRQAAARRPQGAEAFLGVGA